jgi:hypothetical protein
MVSITDYDASKAIEPERAQQTQRRGEKLEQQHSVLGVMVVIIAAQILKIEY